MSKEDDPKYHEAPYTLDPTREIDEDAPPSAGHDAEQAERVKAADDAFTKEVEEEEERLEKDGPVGPKDPTEVDEEGKPRKEAKGKDGKQTVSGQADKDRKESGKDDRAKGR